MVVRSQSHSPAGTGLAWCSLKHFRAIYGSVAAEKAPRLHAHPCQARLSAIKVAQVHVVSQLPLQNLAVHFSIWEILGFIITAVIVSFLGELLVIMALNRIMV